MTEADWLTGTDFAAHVQHVSARLSPRRQRLLATGFCRTVLPYLDRADLIEALMVIEDGADDGATPLELERARQRCRDTAQVSNAEYHQAVDRATGHWRASYVRMELAWATNDAATVSEIPLAKVGTHAAFALKYALAKDAKAPPGIFESEGVTGEPARVMRSVVWEIAGNPFQPVHFSPSWRTDTAVSLAKHMYESREFSAMPILADALQDAGCDSEDILHHCRDTSLAHTRGCWVVDLVLDKS